MVSTDVNRLMEEEKKTKTPKRQAAQFLGEGLGGSS